VPCRRCQASKLYHLRSASGVQLLTAAETPGSRHVNDVMQDGLFSENKSIQHLTAKELSGVRRFKRFVVNVHTQSWFTSRSESDAPVNDVMLIQRLQAYSDENLENTGLAMMQRRSWYLTPQLAVVALFLSLITAEENSPCGDNAG
jgi:hypothetical protein